MQNQNDKNFIVKDVIRVSLKLYKENFKLFFGINAIGILILFFTENFTELGQIFNIVELTILINFIGFVIRLLGIYFNARINIALILAIRSCYCKRRVGIKESIKNAKEFTWGYIGIMLLSGLIIFIPLIVLMGFLKVELLLLKITVIIIAIALILYLIVKYGFAPYIKVLRPEVTNCFSYSMKLVKHNFGKVLIVLIILFIVQSPIYILGIIVDESKLGTIGGLIFANLGFVYNLLVGPLTYGLIVISYLMLDIEQL